MTDSEEAFFKQRRNLIALSLIAAFINVAAVKLDRLNILGNELQISNPKALPIALAVGLTYFVIRYLQYMHDVEDKGFKKRFLSRAEKHLAPYLLRRELHDQTSELARTYAKKNIEDLIVDEFLMFHEAMPPNTASASFIPKNGGMVVEENNLKVSNKELILPFIRAGLYVTFRTRLVTDYALPLLLSGVAYATYVPRVSASVSQWL